MSLSSSDDFDLRQIRQCDPGHQSCRFLDYEPHLRRPIIFPDSDQKGEPDQLHRGLRLPGNPLCKIQFFPDPLYLLVVWLTQILGDPEVVGIEHLSFWAVRSESFQMCLPHFRRRIPFATHSYQYR